MHLFFCSLPYQLFHMRSIIRIACFIFFLPLLAAAQSNPSYNIDYYPGNIYKVSFNPAGYTTNEQLSDAVVLPALKSTPARVAKIAGDNVIIPLKDRELVLSAYTDSIFRGFSISLSDGERIFGGGERALPLNRRGYRFNLYNNPWYGYGYGADNLNYSVPFFTSSLGYGVFFNNPSKGFADIGKSAANEFRAGFVSGALEVFIITGNTYQDILASYHRLTGNQPLPPKWAMGNLMSRFGYTSEAQARSVFEKMKQEKMPVDAIIFDLFWFGDSIKGTLGNLEWVNRKKWLSPKTMIADFKKQGVQTILVTEPFFVETSKNYKSSLPYLAVDSTGKPYYLRDFYFGKGGLIDIFRKDSRDWFWQFYRRQMNIGVEAWWGDLGEPEKHPADLYHRFTGTKYKRLFSADEVHNIYGHNWTKMLFQNFALYYPNKRLFSLNRSGFAGSQRYSIFPWTGDVSRSWSGLKAQLPVLLGMAMSGVPYVHSDAGGFAGGEGDNELYIRWLQFASFTPIFRPHGTALYDADPAAFSFPSEAALIDTPYRYMARKIIDMRHQYLPYNYTLAYRQATAGKPLMAPLYYHFPGDKTASDIEDEYMWGDDLLVAPVIEKGVATRRYYLPEGRWIPLWQDRTQVLQGGNWYQDSVSLENIPVFLREGAFLPQQVDLFTTPNVEKRSDNDYLVIHPVSAKPSSGLMYNDDGVSKNAISTGNFRIIRFNSSGLQNDRHQITMTNEGNFRKGVALNVMLMMPGIEKQPASAKLNGKTIKAEWDDKAKLLILVFEHKGKSVVELIYSK